MGETIWVTALPHGSGVRLRVHDDEGDHPAQPDTAPGPLSLGELIELIDTVPLGDELAPGLVYGLLDYNSMVGSANPADTGFIAVSSEIYPRLAEHYDGRIETWVMGGRDARPGGPKDAA